MAEDNETNVITEDRISELPDDVIHHIFSFLPTIYLVQMSLLSKRWRWMSVSTPFIHWSGRRCYYNFFKGVKKRDFLNIVSNNLKCRKLHMQVPDPFVTSFKFDTDYILTRDDHRRLDDWLSFAIQSKVKEFDLHAPGYCLPELVLNASSITLLKLRNVRLEAPSVSTLPSLKVLSLKYVKSDTKSLRNLISGCPIIEDLKLTYLSVDFDFDFDVSKTLKNLTLKPLSNSTGFTSRWLEDLISGLPLLERFNWNPYNVELHSISIHSHSLKSLSIRRSDNASVPIFTKASIRTPNLTFLDFAFFLKPHLLIEAPKLLEAYLAVTHMYPYKASYNDLVHFLSNLINLNKLVLRIQSTQEIIFVENIRNTCSPPLPNLKHLDVCLCGEWRETTSELQDFWHWCAPSVGYHDFCFCYLIIFERF